MSNQMVVEYVDISSITPHPRNARVHSPSQISLLVGSLADHDFTKPIVTDAKGMILAGHGLYMAAKAAGRRTVPIHRLGKMSDAKARAYLLLDNRLGELSSFERTILAEELTFLIEEKIDVEATGFTMVDVDRIVEEQQPAAGGAESEPAVELPADDDVAVSELGDLWHIGPHRLYCGDARDPVSFDALMAGEIAEMAVIDPPFNVKTQGHISTGTGKARHREFVVGAGELSDPAFTALLRASFRQLARNTVNGAIIYVFMDFRHMRNVLDAADGVFTEHKQLIVWDKQVGALGSFYRGQHELIFVFKSGRGPHINNFSMGEKGAEFGKAGKGRYRTNIWRAPGMSGFHRGREALKFHSTVKPTGLIAGAMLDVSNRGGLIIDSFAGSGTSILAAHRTGRRAFCMELDPLYVDTAIRRIEAATGLIAVHVDGQTFATKAARLKSEG